MTARRRDRVGTIIGLAVAASVVPARADVMRVVSQPSVVATSELGLDARIGGLASEYNRGGFGELTGWIDWRLAGWLKAGAESGVGCADVDLDEAEPTSSCYVRGTSAWLRGIHEWRRRSGTTWRAAVGVALRAPALWIAGLDNETVRLLVLPVSNGRPGEGYLGPVIVADASVRLDRGRYFGQLTAAYADRVDDFNNPYPTEAFAVGGGWRVGRDWSCAATVRGGTYRAFEGGTITGIEVGAEATSGFALAVYIPLQEHRGAAATVTLGYHEL